MQTKGQVVQEPSSHLPVTWHVSCGRSGHRYTDTEIRQGSHANAECRHAVSVGVNRTRQDPADLIAFRFQEKGDDMDPDRSQRLPSCTRSCQSDVSFAVPDIRKYLRQRKRTRILHPSSEKGRRNPPACLLIRSVNCHKEGTVTLALGFDPDREIIIIAEPQIQVCAAAGSIHAMGQI